MLADNEEYEVLFHRLLHNPIPDETRLKDERIVGLQSHGVTIFRCDGACPEYQVAEFPFVIDDVKAARRAAPAT